VARGYRTIILGAVALLSAVPLLGAAGGDASVVLARHKAFMGWANGDGTLTSIRETIALAGATAGPSTSRRDRSEIVRRGLIYRETEFGADRPLGDAGFTGRLFWRSNDNGFTVTVRAHAAAIEITRDVVESEAFGDAPAELRAPLTFDGVKASVVRVTPPGGVPADLYLGDDGAVLGYVLSPDDATDRETVHNVSYAEFAPNKRYVNALRYGTSTRVYRVIDFLVNAPISESDLHPPAPRATWTFGEPRTVPITIRRQTEVVGGSVYVDVAINGHTGRFLLDSGSNAILLTDRFARIAGTQDLGRSAMSGINGTVVEATRIQIATVAIGGNTLHGVIAHRAAPMSGRDQREQTVSDGIIGFDVLASALVDVDLAKGNLTVLDPQENEPVIKGGAYAFTVDLSDFHPAVPIKLQNDVLSGVYLDTGNDFFVILPQAMQKRHVGTFIDQEIFSGIDGDGQYPAICVRLDEIQVGPFSYKGAPSCFAPNEAFGKTGGLIGFDFLRHFNWTFDYAHSQLVLTPNGN
jgi:predicted aspartyl protease